MVLYIVVLATLPHVRLVFSSIRFGRNQPDNADLNENCLAILNNFYGDGIIWHDVDCSLDKYVICERPTYF